MDKFFELIVSAVALITSMIFLVSALILYQVSPRPFLESASVFPVIFAGVVGIISGSLLIKLFTKEREEVFTQLRGLKEYFVEEKDKYFKLFVIVTVTFIYIVLLMPKLGFMISTFIFLVATLTFFGRVKWWKAVIGSALLSSGIYYFFLNVLGIYLP